jgi:cyclohexanecarboxylate-CoA ligase/acyl-CoA synthetase
MEELLRHSGAVACVAVARAKGRSPAGEVAALGERLPRLRRVIAVGERIAGTDNFADLLAGGSAELPLACSLRSTQPFLLLYTSGTTSAPKAVAVTSNHFLSNTRMSAARLGIAGDRLLCLAPFTHLYGLGTLQLCLAGGATACLLDLFTPESLVEVLRQYRPTILFGGPAHIAPCLQQGLLRDVDFSELRFAVLSGTTVPPAVSAGLEDLLPHGKVIQAWGMTEMLYGCFGEATCSREVRFGSVGRATPGTELRIVDADEQVLPPGKMGELQARGGSLFEGDVGNDEATRGSFTSDGWLRTGDLAQIDADGNVFLSGRSKDLINRGGIKFNPVDMETAIGSHPAVMQVAIAPVPDERLGERAACFVVLRDGASLGLEAVRDFLEKRHFSKVTWPEYLVIVPELPLTPTRKVMKSLLVQQYGGSLVAPP